MALFDLDVSSMASARGEKRSKRRSRSIKHHLEKTEKNPSLSARPHHKKKKIPQTSLESQSVIHRSPPKPRKKNGEERKEGSRKKKSAKSAPIMKPSDRTNTCSASQDRKKKVTKKKKKKKEDLKQFPNPPDQLPPTLVSDAEVDRKLLLRRAALQEILTSERVYANSLRILVNEFLQPTMQRKLLPPTDRKKIFGNLGEILMLTTRFLHSIEERYAQWPAVYRVSDLFIEFAPMMQLYSKYAAGYTVATQTLCALRSRKKSPFYQFLQKRSEKFAVEKTPSLDLQAYLIMPIQRPPRYELLLKELIKHTLHDDQDLQNLLDALHTVQNVNQCINETKMAVDLLVEFDRIEKIQQEKESHRKRRVSISFSAHHQRVTVSPVALRTHSLYPPPQGLYPPEQPLHAIQGKLRVKIDRADGLVALLTQPPVRGALTQDTPISAFIMIRCGEKAHQTGAVIASALTPRQVKKLSSPRAASERVWKWNEQFILNVDDICAPLTLELYRHVPIRGGSAPVGGITLAMARVVDRVLKEVPQSEWYPLFIHEAPKVTAREGQREENKREKRKKSTPKVLDCRDYKEYGTPRVRVAFQFVGKRSYEKEEVEEEKEEGMKSVTASPSPQRKESPSDNVGVKPKLNTTDRRQDWLSKSNKVWH